MAKFLILYRSTMPPGEAMEAGTPDEMKAEMDLWMAWGGGAGPALVDFGSPTIPTSQEDPGPAGWIGGYSIMEAADVDALNGLLETHPHKRMGTIEVLQMLDMPGM